MFAESCENIRRRCLLCASRGRNFALVVVADMPLLKFVIVSGPIRVVVALSPLLALVWLKVPVWSVVALTPLLKLVTDNPLQGGSAWAGTGAATNMAAKSKAIVVVMSRMSISPLESSSWNWKLDPSLGGRCVRSGPIHCT